ncbi:hypothetical protein BP6252_04248 [Coleophoma cylindrospora]|uniref:Mitochondrial K+-H+ exchange-related-domain-containing protein n=1 Tax=Coleophoma cylindrospora TaxID=1849047 RepID=A0A3D8S0F8_9HELO|nr:hypothetical protein BP6252_04248 [Coleophoma cylindrospora]
MRLFLFPISTRRTLIYCQRLNVTTSEQQTLLDKGTSRAAALWSSWEKKESGWQKKVVDYGNKALQRIPYEEWGLKSIPPLSARRKEEELSGKEKVEVSFPGSLIPEATITDLLRKLGTERQSLHKKRMMWSFVGMPISAPIALIPVIPNLPFFYLVYRAWSHWRALSGSKHIEFLLDNKLLTIQPSKILDDIYASGESPFIPTPALEQGSTTTSGSEAEKMLIHKSTGKKIAEVLKVPELEMELDRAVWQVEKAISAEAELKREKKDLDGVNEESKKEK